MVRFTDSNVVDDYPPRQPSRNGRWSPDYHYAGGAAPPSPGGSVRGGSGGHGGPYMTGPFPAPSTQAPPPAPVLTRENSLQVPHWDRYRPRSVPPPLSPTNDNSTVVFPPSRPRSRNHDRDYDRDRDRHEERSSRRKPTSDRETKGRHRERYYDSESSSSDDDRKSNKPSITRSRTPLSKARHALSSTFSDSTTGLGAGVIGAIVGGLAAREASENLLAKGDGHRHGDHHHNGKEALLSTIAGAAVGALGANALEKRIEASRNKKSSSSSSAAATSPSKGSDDGRNYTWGHERRRSSTIEDKRDNRDRERDRETYKERDLRRYRSQRRGSRDNDRDRERERHRYHTTDDESEDEIVYDHQRRKAPNRDRDRSRPRRGDDWR